MTVGIIPAAGTAARMRGIPKAFLPIPDDTTLMGSVIQRMNVVTDNVVCIPNRNLLSASYGSVSGCRFMYTYPVETKTMSETVLSVRESCQDDDVLFGMCDTYIEDADCFRKLAACLQDGADVAVACFHARKGQHTEGGMVQFVDEALTFADGVSGNYPVFEIYDKPINRVSNWIWGALAWKPVFWQHILATDAHVGFGVQRAVDSGLDVRAVKMDGGFWDCGTSSRYFALINFLTRGE